MQIKILSSILFTICTFISSCGITEPFIDTRREAGKDKPVGQSTPDRIVICYNGNTSSPEKIKKIADAECEKTGRTAVFEERKSLSCRLLLPSRAYFRCKKNKETANSKDEIKALPEQNKKIKGQSIENRKNISMEDMPNYDPMTYEEKEF